MSTADHARGLAAAAQWYAAHGVRVFPLRPRTKRPMHEGWPELATTDAATIRAWWEATPDANIGVVMGGPFDVLDLDTPDAINDTRDRLGGAFPPDLGAVVTPRKSGLHFWIPATGRRRAIGILPGVDWLGAGGYAVAPPSFIRWPDDPAHGITAGEGAYRWAGEPDLTGTADAAPWLALWADRDASTAQRTPTPPPAAYGPPRAAGASPWAARALAEECATVAATAPGTRNDVLNRAAFRVGQLVPHLLTEADALDALTDAGRACGLPDAEAAATIRSGLNGGRQNPRQPEDRRQPPAPAPDAAPPSWADEPPEDPWADPPPEDDPYDEPGAPPDDPGEARRAYTFRPAGAFILDESALPAAWWGAGESVLAACGESLIIAGPQGTGKSTIAQQLALGRAGFPEYADLFGYPIRPGGGRVLYLAMDRPRQVARSFRRMVGDSWRAELDAKVSVWAGPPPYDLAKHPSVLTRMAEDAGADLVVVDSLKDAAVGLTDDEVGAGYNRARQHALRAGVELLELHHSRKASGGVTREHLTLDDVYGSTWISSGAGSVLLLNGAAGDPIVKVHHVKQPLSEVGPLRIVHDAESGRSTIFHATDLVAMAKASGGLSALDAARAMFETDKPDAAAKEKARRRLDALTRSGSLIVLDEGDKATSRPRLWGAA